MMSLAIFAIVAMMAARSFRNINVSGRKVEAAMSAREAENLMLQHNVPMLDTTSKSIEEIATTILHRAKLARHIF